MSFSFLYACLRVFCTFASLLLLLANGAENSSFCLEKLPHLDVKQLFNVSINGSATSFSTASAIAYHIPSGNVLISGELILEKERTKSTPSVHAYFLVFNDDSMSTLKFQHFWRLNASAHELLAQTKRSWTRIEVHPTEEYFYVYGMNFIRAYSLANGHLLWQSDIQLCSDPKVSPTANPRRIYNSLTFPQYDAHNLFIAGTCYDNLNRSQVVVDLYNYRNGSRPQTLADQRILKNMSRVIYGIVAGTSIDLGHIPADITIAAPVNNTLETQTTRPQYFYVSANHLIFQGLARFEKEKLLPLYRVIDLKVGGVESSSVLNPALFAHESMVVTVDDEVHGPINGSDGRGRPTILGGKAGVLALIDPVLDLETIYYGERKHFIRYAAEFRLNRTHVVNESTNATEPDEHYHIHDAIVYHENIWFGTHTERNLHSDWTLAMDARHEFAYVTVTPLDIRAANSSIAKHNVSSGAVVGAQYYDFYVTDTVIATASGVLISVGFDWRPVKDREAPNRLLNHFAAFQRTSSVSVVNTCVGCQRNHYGAGCEHDCKVKCWNGYCSDDLVGNGECFCPLYMYGKHCADPCACAPDRGICDNGVDGSGLCSLCFPIESITDRTFTYKYGPHCKLDCPCTKDNGICDIRGFHSTEGKCIHCSNSKHFGTFCNDTCRCDHGTEYCDNGVSGAGCVAYDYGGIAPNTTWYTYVIIGASIFGLLFAVVAYKTYTESQSEGRKIPCCPSFKKKAKSAEDDDNGDGHGIINAKAAAHNQFESESIGINPNEVPIALAGNRDVNNDGNNNPNERMLDGYRQQQHQQQQQQQYYAQQSNAQQNDSRGPNDDVFAV